MTIGDVAQIAGITGLAVSILLLAWQTKQLAQQTRISNSVGISTAHYNALERQHDVSKLLMQYIELWPYFYDHTPCPSGDPNRERALLVAEMIGDIHDYGLEMNRRFPDEIHGSCWKVSASTVAQQPVVREAFKKYGMWWPDLTRYLGQAGVMKEEDPPRDSPFNDKIL